VTNYVGKRCAMPTTNPTTTNDMNFPQIGIGP
jgi:hypothetical protein